MRAPCPKAVELIARTRPRRSLHAFTLLEVVAAVGIFAIGMVAVVGLFAPVTKSMASVSEAEAAARVSDAVQARLQAMPFDQALALIQTAAAVRANDADGTYNPGAGASHPAVLFGQLNGEVGVYDVAKKNWRDGGDRVVADANKFFEIDLIRNATLSPAANDDTAPMIAYTMRVRWPAYVLTTATTAVQNGQNATGGAVPFDQSKKQVIFFTGSLTR